MKTAEELNALKEEVEVVSRKLADLTKEELEQVTGGEDTSCACPRGFSSPCPACFRKGCSRSVSYPNLKQLHCRAYELIILKRSDGSIQIVGGKGWDRKMTM